VAIGQHRQLAAVPLWKMRAGEQYLLFDQVEVVQQPFTCRCYATRVVCRRHQQAAGGLQQGFVVAQPLQQPVVPGRGIDGVQAGQSFAVALHLFGAEQLGAQRYFGGVALPFDHEGTLCSSCQHGAPGPGSLCAIAPRRLITGLRFLDDLAI